MAGLKRAWEAIKTAWTIYQIATALGLAGVVMVVARVFVDRIDALGFIWEAVFAGSIFLLILGVFWPFVIRVRNKLPGKQPVAEPTNQTQVEQVQEKISLLQATNGQLTIRLGQTEEELKELREINTQLTEQLLSPVQKAHFQFLISLENWYSNPHHIAGCTPLVALEYRIVPQRKTGNHYLRLHLTFFNATIFPVRVVRAIDRGIKYEGELLHDKPELQQPNAALAGRGHLLHVYLHQHVRDVWESLIQKGRDKQLFELGFDDLHLFVEALENDTINVREKTELILPNLVHCKVADLADMLRPEDVEDPDGDAGRTISVQLEAPRGVEG